MIIGADVGTQSLKVAVLDDRLRTVGRAARCYQPSYPKPGWVEQAPSLWTDALGPAIAEALQAAQVSPARYPRHRVLRPARRLHRRR